MDGTSLAIATSIGDENHITCQFITIVFNKWLRFIEPTSSSPQSWLILQGIYPCSLSISKALRCMNICPLSSQAPRAKMAPSDEYLFA